MPTIISDPSKSAAVIKAISICLFCALWYKWRLGLGMWRVHVGVQRVKSWREVAGEDVHMWGAWWGS